MPAPKSPDKSTNVRSQSRSLRRFAVRAAFRVLDRSAPSLAAWWALRIWCTLPTNAGSRRDNRPYAGRRSDVDLPDGCRVAVEVWEPDRPSGTVYLVHGWGGWRGQLGAFVAPFLDTGRRVVAFDAPSHGDSAPSTMGRGRATMLDFIDALVAVSARFGEPDGVVAHSLGCTTSAMAVADGLRTRRLAFVAAGVDPLGSSLGQLERFLGYGRRTHRELFARIERLAQRPLDDFNVLIRRHNEAPAALVVHDRQDKESQYDDGVRLAESWPEAELVSTDGLGHQRILRDDGVIKLVVDHLTT